MLTFDRAIYRIDGFFPPQESGRLGGYGFSIGLDPVFSRKALETEISEQGFKNLQKIGRGIVNRVGLAREDDKFILPPYNFFPLAGQEPRGNHKVSCLLQSCTVPGTACTISVSWSDLSSLRENSTNFLEYSPHNIDSLKQAYALLSIWIKWLDLIEAFLEKE